MRDAEVAGTQYYTYMRLEELLNLQRTPEVWAHRDELRFQVVHQATELFLKLAGEEIATASRFVVDGQLDEAARLVVRASHDLVAITALLEPLSDIRPSDFLEVRPVLGNGSGAESPGWESLREVAADVWQAFQAICSGSMLRELNESSPHTAEFRLAEALVDLDQRVCLWRARHYELLARIVGEDVVGTAGTPVKRLRATIHDRLFPALWSARTDLTQRQQT